MESHLEELIREYFILIIKWPSVGDSPSIFCCVHVQDVYGWACQMEISHEWVASSRAHPPPVIHKVRSAIFRCIYRAHQASSSKYIETGARWDRFLIWMSHRYAQEIKGRQPSSLIAFPWAQFFSPLPSIVNLARPFIVSNTLKECREKQEPGPVINSNLI